jgi:hypothetical protein
MKHQGKSDSKKKVIECHPSRRRMDTTKSKIAVKLYT